jgi:hypothetical protein
MSKHTPGPWQSKSDYEPMTIIGNVDGPDDGEYHYTPICEVEPTLFPDENAANARLIAAAPELLKVLEDICEWIINWSPNFMEDPGWAVTAARSRAAIAKAKGGA